MSAIFLRSGCGSMPRSRLYATCFSRRRSVSPIALIIESVMHVGVHVHLARDVARGTTDRLDERGSRAQEALFVGVEDRDERHLGQVEALRAEVDADEHVVHALPQLGEQLDAAQRVDVGVQVAHANPVLAEELGELFGHLLREGRDEHSLVLLDSNADLLEQVVDLAAATA